MQRPPFPTRTDLIRGWIDYFSKRDVDNGQWADFLLDDIITDFPDESWSIILELMNAVHDNTEGVFFHNGIKRSGGRGNVGDSLPVRNGGVLFSSAGDKRF